MDLTPYHYKAYGLSIASEIPLPPLPTSVPTTADLTIRREQLPGRPPVEATKIYRAGLNARFAQQGLDYLWLDWSPLISFTAVSGNELLVDTTQTDEDLVSLFTLSEALGLILFQKGYFLLHGSAVRIGSKGVVFLGEPGAGKSTTVAACAQKGYTVISDDMVCIQVNETGNLLLIPAFPQIKIWQSTIDGLQLHREKMAPVREGVDKFSWYDSIKFEENAVPLTAIFVLLPPRKPGSTTDPIPASRVPVELLHHFPLADALLKGKSLEDYFKKSVAIAQTIPLFRMSRPADFAGLHEFVTFLKSRLT
ncbi:hypothetical protein [Spirosoma spitsbergense]|uniref:hypothetical protein n=1 Tax=Spirosoma spitsbergense TaxID=431554 RepID=UPI000378F512|nr:hypothetical protein [Spirosoma spitsbergense]